MIAWWEKLFPGAGYAPWGESWRGGSGCFHEDTSPLSVRSLYDYWSVSVERHPLSVLLFLVLLVASLGSSVWGNGRPLRNIQYVCIISPHLWPHASVVNALIAGLHLHLSQTVQLRAHSWQVEASSALPEQLVLLGISGQRWTRYGFHIDAVTSNGGRCTNINTIFIVPW